MKIAERLLSVAVVLLLSAASVLAENTVMGVSNDIRVEVIKISDDTETLVYTGLLSGYDNGIWANTDLTGNNRMIVFDWDSDDEYHIVPIGADETEGSITANYQMPDNAYELQNTDTSNSIQTNLVLVYNNTYYENVLLPGQTLSIPVTVTNNGEITKEFISYIAVYDLSGKLTDVVQGSIITAPANSTVTAELTKTFSTDTASTAKVLIWEKDTMKPVSDSIHMTIQNQDYYPDSFENALDIDLDKPVCGIINTSTDVDIVKLVPDTTGVYALEISSDNGTTCGIYNSEQTALSSVENNGYLMYSLVAGQTYYVRIGGAENNNYKIIPTLPGDIVTAVKNVGSLSSFSENNTYDVYKFTPAVTGSYIITAIDSTNVKAELYNSNLVKISSSDTGDDDVSFRITGNMTANEDYYIIVSPKNSNQTGSYTMYIEEPFALISVE